MGDAQANGAKSGFGASWSFLEPEEEESCLYPFPRLAQSLQALLLGGPNSQVCTFVVMARLTAKWRLYLEDLKRRAVPSRLLLCGHHGQQGWPARPLSYLLGRILLGLELPRGAEARVRAQSTLCGCVGMCYSSYVKIHSKVLGSEFATHCFCFSCGASCCQARHQKNPREGPAWYWRS